jgi:hypothetical protein
LAFSSLSAPAFSDISVEEVWADTKNWMLIYPSTDMTFGEVESFGDRLVAKDIRIVYDDENIVVTARIEVIEIKEVGDGSIELSTDLELSLVAPDQFSFPVAVNTQIGFRITMPLGKKEGDFEFSAGLRDLYVNNEVWYMFDPEQAEELSRADIPGQIKSISLDDLDIQGLGLELTGDGSFVFDNDDLITILGIPRLKGSAEVELIGSNTFIDTLTNKGLLAQDNAMQARVMLMLFAKPDPSVDDKLTSRWEIKEDGKITANGQRVR